MEIKVTENGEKAILSISGSIDTNTARDAEAVFQKAGDSHQNVVLDISGVSYVSSAGLKIIRNLYIQLYRKSGRLTLENVNGTVMSVLEMTGLSDVLGLDGSLPNTMNKKG